MNNEIDRLRAERDLWRESAERYLQIAYDLCDIDKQLKEVDAALNPDPLTWPQIQDWLAELWQRLRGSDD